MKIFIAAVALLILSNFGCTKKAETSADPTQASAEQTSDSGATPDALSKASPEKPPQCPEGKSVKVYEGRCGGSWAIAKQEDGANSCIFNWGPVKECPKGSVAIGYKAVCYGTLQKPGAASTELCSSQYGNPPAVTPYKLICCE